MKRFPLRTLLLMVLALVVFARLWCATRDAATSAQRPQPFEVTVQPLPPADAGS